MRRAARRERLRLDRLRLGGWAARGPGLGERFRAEGGGVAERGGPADTARGRCTRQRLDHVAEEQVLRGDAHLGGIAGGALDIPVQVRLAAALAQVRRVLRHTDEHLPHQTRGHGPASRGRARRWGSPEAARARGRRRHVRSRRAAGRDRSSKAGRRRTVAGSERAGGQPATRARPARAQRRARVWPHGRPGLGDRGLARVHGGCASIANVWRKGSDSGYVPGVGVTLVHFIEHRDVAQLEPAARRGVQLAARLDVVAVAKRAGSPSEALEQDLAARADEPGVQAGYSLAPEAQVTVAVRTDEEVVLRLSQVDRQWLAGALFHEHSKEQRHRRERLVLGPPIVRAEQGSVTASRGPPKSDSGLNSPGCIKVPRKAQGARHPLGSPTTPRQGLIGRPADKLGKARSPSGTTCGCWP